MDCPCSLLLIMWIIFSCMCLDMTLSTGPNVNGKITTRLTTRPALTHTTKPHQEKAPRKYRDNRPHNGLPIHANPKLHTRKPGKTYSFFKPRNPIMKGMHEGNRAVYPVHTNISVPSNPSQDLRKHAVWNAQRSQFIMENQLSGIVTMKQAMSPSKGAPWPLPQQYSVTQDLFTLHPHHIKITFVFHTCDVVEFYLRRVWKMMFGTEDGISEALKGHPKVSSPPPEGSIQQILVSVLQPCTKYPTLESDEQYELEVADGSVLLLAREVWGLIRGLETLSQIAYPDETGQLFINGSTVIDFPRFRHRGILLDTARHYLEKETIIENLEAMAQNKMNVFHWHIVDDESFPFESKTFPNITKFGAFNKRTHIYTQEVIAEIIEEARLRGIRVIPEFDTPAHSLSWGYGQKDLLTPCFVNGDKFSGVFGPFNPLRNSTYAFLHKFFQEVLDVFPDSFVHLGGDEVPFYCWATNPEIAAYVQDHDDIGYNTLVELYHLRLQNIVRELGSERRSPGGGIPIVWQELFDDGVELPKDSIVQIWKSSLRYVNHVLDKGYRVLFSSCWYLDWISYGVDWPKYYLCEDKGYDASFQRTTFRNESRILGGEACMWAEFVDASGLMSRLWPRASAVAERLWSDQDMTNSIQDAAPRMEEHRCRMIRRGLKVGVASGPGYCEFYPKFNLTTLSPIADNFTVEKFVPRRGYLQLVLIVISLLTLFSFVPLYRKYVKQKSLSERMLRIAPNPNGILCCQKRQTSKSMALTLLALGCVWCCWWVYIAGLNTYTSNTLTAESKEVSTTFNLRNIR